MLRSEPAAERCLRAFVRRVLAISDKAEQPLGLFASLRRRPGRSMRADSEETLPTEHAKAPDRLTVAGIPNGFARWRQSGREQGGRWR